MKDKKNLVIGLLTGLLALSLFTQPAQSAGSSKEAKIVEYDHCITLRTDNTNIDPFYFYSSILKDCLKYKP